MLNFTLRQLQVFEKVATHLNYSRAAEELYLSQPGVSMQIKQLEGHIGLPVLKQLADNNTDLAIMGQPPDNLDISAEPFMDNPLVVIAAPDHPLAKLKRVKFAQLAQETFLSREPGSGTRSAMERVFAERHIQPRISMEMETNEAIKQAVQAGMGLGILSLHSIELELKTKRLAMLKAKHFPLLRHWFVAHRSNKRLSGAALAFKEFLLTEAR